ncbi:MAG TPA: type II secretion system F family protein [Jatrophihabitans sp.]|uniref:type II secretion system F family protein n=1 Tax=Jatrophihabitans sp. TaxID=1932789 RepID=UPI002EFE5845
MPGLTLALLGAGLLIAPVPMVAQRRLAWLAATRWGGPAAAGLPRRAGWPSARLVLARCARLVGSRRDGERRRAELAAIVAVLQDEYAAGATVGTAFVAATAVSGRFRVAIAGAAALARNGHEVTAALRAESGLSPLAVACDLAARSGVPLGPSLAGVQADLAADQRTCRAVRTALAGPRSSALLLSGLPLLGLAMAAAMGAQPQRLLLHTGAGRLALIAGVFLDLAGLAWTAALSRRAQGGRTPR